MLLNVVGNDISYGQGKIATAWKKVTNDNFQTERPSADHRLVDATLGAATDFDI